MNEVLTSEKKWAIVSAIVATTAAAAGFTFCGPVITLLLERMTGSGTFIGTYAAAGAVTTVLITPITPRLLSKISFKALIVSCILIAAVILPAYYFVKIPYVWIAFRFIQGLCLTIIFVACETWINQVAPERMRGRILALYAMALSGGFAIGAGAASGVIAAFGLDGIAPFLIGTGIVIIGIVPFLNGAATRFVPPSSEHSSIGVMLKICRAEPGIIAGGIIFGGIEASMFHLTPVYGVRIGFIESVAALLLLGLGIGNILLQWPVGVMADKFDRLRLLRGFMALCIIVPLTFILIGTYAPGLFMIVGLYTGIATGIYTIALVILGERYKGERMTAANASLIFAYGLGSFTIPMLAGASMDIFGAKGFPLTLSAFGAIGFLVLLAGKHRQKITAHPG